ncbi:winged helix-turn-helix transcriptional regulator [Alicyclobacillus cycloheptanicus]|uniref:DNA-binding MarR family transcriptional regulator n=1 Tax=Alicyclobacillus cycloheptanicus TaxID=1457 RepID=A0ABT9XE08_9BACL|nr:MarR family winged helix-turn-helix transcriptional regulator [Alicyclobacillus cycloheptanicus]MDQ0188532.1 DNA-binding MarR family transcriptional regulator [Alicyclobacillus cycloheptanicus]WDM01217.1 winged helix-turn-helix transcriptional regulator [Alicyclobacillus cycloheptanicus]
MRTDESAKKISRMFSEVYFYCHPAFDIELSHQAVRALQYIQMTGSTNVQNIAYHLACAQNTASEIVRRLRQKGLVEKRRKPDDERVVEVVLTIAGQRAVRQHTGLDVERLTTLLEQVSDAERDAIEHGISLLLKVVRGEKT